jgi:hypothetical protein
MKSDAEMQFTGEDAERFAAIHRLLRKHQLQVMGSVFNSQAEVDRAYEQTAELMTRTIPHEAGHAVIGLALDAGDVLEWIAVYAVRDDDSGSGCGGQSQHPQTPIKLQHDHQQNPSLTYVFGLLGVERRSLQNCPARHGDTLVCFLRSFISVPNGVP